MTKKVIVFGTAVMTTLLAMIALWQFRKAVVYVLTSLALAATVRPFFKGWTRHSWAKRLALILLCLAGLGGFGFVLFLVGKFVIGDIQLLSQTLSVHNAWKLPPWLEGGSFQQLLTTWLPTPDKFFEALTGEQGQLVLPAILGFTQGFGGIVAGVLVIGFLSLYWSIDQIHFERLGLSLLPSGQRKQARDTWRTIESDIGAYIRSEIIQSILAALLLGIGYRIFGSPYPTLLALVGSLVWLIPVVGGAIAVLPPLLLGMLTGIPLSLFTAIFTLAVLIGLQVWVEPRLLKRKWSNPILTLVILLAMADAFGLIGILVAPPLSAICQIIWTLLVSNRLVAGTVTRVSDLKERQARLEVAIKAMNEPPPPLVISSMERLAKLIEKAAPILQEALPPEPPDLFHAPHPYISKDGQSATVEP
ncbi:MAG: AI-2E family transporter [Chloroflexi bacterium]|nr:AI-2E family transporter [Chloroflexota bacterium]